MEKFLKFNSGAVHNTVTPKFLRLYVFKNVALRLDISSFSINITSFRSKKLSSVNRLGEIHEYSLEELIKVYAKLQFQR